VVAQYLLGYGFAFLLLGLAREFGYHRRVMRVLRFREHIYDKTGSTDALDDITRMIKSGRELPMTRRRSRRTTPTTRDRIRTRSHEDDLG
jgi:hypothetical protein